MLLNTRHLYMTNNQLKILQKLVITEMNNGNIEESNLLKQINIKISNLLKLKYDEYCILSLKIDKTNINLISNICLSKKIKLNTWLLKEKEYKYEEYFSEKFSLKNYYIEEINNINRLNEKILYYLINFDICCTNHIVL